MDSRPAITFHDGQATLNQLDDVTKLYLEVYAEPPYNSGPIWHESAFIERTKSQVQRDGFLLTAARLPDDTLIGFCFGLPFAKGQWWSSGSTIPSADLLSATKFAIIELVVAKAFRRQGIGHDLLYFLLGKRQEAYATLSAIPQSPASGLYRRWGWTQVPPAPGQQTFEVLILPLPDKSATSDRLTVEPAPHR